MTLPITDSYSTRIPEIPGYRVVRRLGEGGMAEIHLAIQLSLQRQVALKVLAYEHSVSEELAERFEREARTIARLDHPHIVAIHEVGRTRAGLLYYTMPYLPNGDLAHRDLRAKPLEVVRVLRAVLQALAYAHAQHVVHRDVKPENILFDKTDRPLLADFGIALSRDDRHRVTNPGRTLGSSGYMSPEQARGQELDGRADLYSLGVVAYEVLTGELPYAGADALAMAISHMQDPLPRVPAAHRAWQPFLDRALSKSLNDRFQSAEEMQRALDDVERRLAAQSPVAAAAEREPLRVRGPLLLLFGIVLALAAIVVVGGIGPYAPRDEVEVAQTPPGPPVSAVAVGDMDEWLSDAYAALGEGRLVEADGNDAATPVLKLLALSPTNGEALQALGKIFDSLAKQAERALGRDAGDQAVAAQERALQLRQRAGEAGEPAWSAFRKRYTDGLLSALDRAAARGDSAAPTT
ncbi:MAG TPA: protein kinase, partial [Xanthomonadales bacterium]|nr:protein kinase [Xanthomonadales bacterium]